MKQLDINAFLETIFYTFFFPAKAVFQLELQPH